MEKRVNATAVILAGGRATRMAGQDKGLQLLKGKPLWQHVAERVAPQVSAVILSANRNLAEYARGGLPVINDTLADYPGPLAGMLATMRASYSEWLLFCPCDTPFLPDDLAQRLWQNKGEAKAAWVTDGERDHPTIALLHRSLADALEGYLAQGERRVMHFLRQVEGKRIAFTDKADCFVNVNTLDELAYWQEK